MFSLNSSAKINLKISLRKSLNKFEEKKIDKFAVLFSHYCSMDTHFYFIRFLFLNIYMILIDYVFF
jgi:hypothetical protein